MFVLEFVNDSNAFLECFRYCDKYIVHIVIYAGIKFMCNIISQVHCRQSRLLLINIHPNKSQIPSHGLVEADMVSDLR